MRFGVDSPGPVGLMERTGQAERSGPSGLRSEPVSMEATVELEKRERFSSPDSAIRRRSARTRFAFSVIVATVRGSSNGDVSIDQSNDIRDPVWPSQTCMSW